MRTRIVGVGKGLWAKQPNYVFYFLSFARGLPFGLIGSVYALLLFSKGLTPLQVGSINIVFSLTSFLAQVPTGALADVWGRKKSFLISIIFFALSFFVYASTESWPYFVFAEVCSGLGFALMTGALDAWAVDQLALSGYLGRTDFLFSRSEVSLNLAQIVGALGTVYLVRFGLQAPFWAGGIIFLLCLPLGWILIAEPQGERHFSFDTHKMLSVVKAGYHYSLKNIAVGMIILYSTLLVLGLKGLDMFWSKRFEDLSSPETVSKLWVVMTIALVIGSHGVKKLADKGRSQLEGMILSTIGITICISLSALSKLFLPAAGFFVLYETFRGGFRPLYSSYLNLHTPSVIRATVISFQGMMMNLAGIVGLFLSGFLATRFSIATAWLAACLFFWLAILPLFRLSQKDNS